MMQSRRIAARLSLACVVSSLAACGGSSGGGGGGGGPPTPVNLAPEFGCVETVVTAGGPRILVRWRPATDDNDAPGALRYRVFLSATSGGHVFTTPVATSAPGATSMQLTSASSPLIAEGVEVFVVVRAVDTSGAENPNRVECPCTPVPTSAVAYVRLGAGGPGTLGDPGDPFPTLSPALAAVPATGGVVVVGSGIHTGLFAATGAGAGGSRLGVYGGFPASSITAGATATSLLTAFDPVGSPSIVDGTASDPSTVVDQLGHLDVRNGGRRTYLGALSFRDDPPSEEALIGAQDADLVVSGCSFVDLDRESNARPIGVFVGTSGPTEASRLHVVGCFFDECEQSVRAEGGVERVVLGGNRAEDGVQHLLLDAATIPAGSDWLLALDCEDVTRLRSNPLFADMSPETVGAPGSVTIRIERCRVTGCDSRMWVRGFGEHGSTGPCSVRLSDCFVGPIDSNCLTLDFLPAVFTDTEVLAAPTTDLTVRNSTFVHANSDGIDPNYWTPAAGATVSHLFEDLTIVQNDSEAFDGSSHSANGSETFSQDGAQVDTVCRRVNLFSVDGLFWWQQRVFRGGRSTLEMYDCVGDGLTDEFLDGDVSGYQTPVTALAAPNSAVSVVLRDNVCTSRYNSSTDFADMEVYVDGPDVVVRILRNDISTADECVRCSVKVADGASSPGIDFLFEGNRVDQRDDDNVLDLDFFRENLATELDVVAKICNNVMRSGRDCLEVYCSSELSDARGYLLVAHNDFSGSTEGDNMDCDLEGGRWSVLCARNLALAGGDDSEVGLSVDVSYEAVGGDVILRNNLVTGTGEGVGSESGQSGIQVINNTVAFVGEGPSDVPLGSDQGGPNNPSHIRNCVSHGNNFHDVPKEAKAIWSILEEPVSSAGFGSIIGDPVFAKAGSLLTPQTFLALSAASPARDAGDPDPDFDDRNGTRNDMGCFGGPGSGPVGALATKTTPCPLLLIGVDPFVDLYTGADFVGTTQPITLVFNHPIAPATVTGATLSVTSGGVVPVVYSVAGARVTLTPTVAWAAGAWHKLVVTTGLESTTGIPLDHRHARWFPVAPAGAVAETEANNSVGTADGIPGDVARVIGSLSSDADADFFVFTAVAGQRVQAQLFAERPAGDSPADFALRLYASDGTTVLYENWEALQTYDPMVDFTVLATGTYYLEVFDQGSGAGAGPFPWELRFAKR